MADHKNGRKPCKAAYEQGDVLMNNFRHFLALH
jgi:hypothetical protein